MRQLCVTVLLLMCGALLRSAEAIPVAAEGYMIEKFVDIPGPVGLATDPAGNLYVGHDPPGGEYTEPARIRCVSSDGVTVFELGDVLPDPDTVIVDVGGRLGMTGAVLVGAGASIRQVDPSTGQTSTRLSGTPLTNVADMEFDSAGRLFVGQLNGPLCVVEGGVPRPFASVPTGNSPQGVAIDGEDNIFVLCRTSGTVFRVDLLGLADPVPFATLAEESSTIEYTSHGVFAGALFAGTFEGRVYRIDLNTGDVSAVASGLNEASGIAFASDGTMFVSDTTGNAVYRITPEPTSVGLLAVGTLLVICRQRRRCRRDLPTCMRLGRA